uniref:Putative secreted protein n=1 Tax=Anopheles marajoara TaxID=58244 RepID=A0A2M4CER1_9DIPT
MITIELCGFLLVLGSSSSLHLESTLLAWQGGLIRLHIRTNVRKRECLRPFAILTYTRNAQRRTHNVFRAC